MKYDIIIIGCGISSLFFLYNLHKKNSNLKVCIIEKKPYIGGRIQSIKIDNQTIDSGALRFSKNHKELIKLLKELDITDYKKLPKYEKLNKKYRDFLEMTSTKKYAKYPFSSIAKEHFTLEEYAEFKLWFGYDEKWNNSQCYLLSKSLMKNYNSDDYFYFPDGFSILPQKIFDIVKDKFTFHFGTKVSKISPSNNIYTLDNSHFTADHIIFTCPPHYIQKIEGTNNLTPILAAIGSQTLNRIYAYFPRQKWFPKKIIHCSSPIGQIYPLLNDIMMISYSSGTDAEYNLTRDKIWDGKHKPKWVKQNYWNPATHYYYPGFEPEKIQDLSFKPLENENWYIIGESFSINQGWVDGAIENTKKFIKKFENKSFVKEKIYSMKEVEKNNYMIIWNNVYDVKEWIPKHPGGDIIKIGLGKDATKIFENIGHSKDAIRFMEKYKIGIISTK